jgi:hypothetical protein
MDHATIMTPQLSSRFIINRNAEPIQGGEEDLLQSRSNKNKKEQKNIQTS